MALDLRFMIDGQPTATTQVPRYATQFHMENLLRSRTLTVEARSVLRGGPPIDVRIFGQPLAKLTVNELSQPVISSFMPTSGQFYDSVVIYGDNFNWVRAVTFNYTRAIPLTVASNTMIRTTVPVHATTGPIRVSNYDDNTNLIPSNDSFVVVPMPPLTISDFTPVSGRDGTVVTIHGSTFSRAWYVKFNGVTANFIKVSDSTITATVPVNATSGPISVEAEIGIVTSSKNFEMLPLVDRTEPTFGLRGSVVTIIGSHFSGTNTVQFNGVNANFQVVSDTTITASVPALATSGLVNVINRGGPAARLQAIFEVIFPPYISGFSPAEGKVGTGVTITGSHLSEVNTVQFNGVNANFHVVSDTTITASVPAFATSGPLSVISRGGRATSPTSFVILIPANLRFTGTWMYPTEFPAVGQPFTVYFNFMNNGGTATGKFTIRLQLDNNVEIRDIASQSYEPNTGGYVWWSFPNGFSSPGEHFIYVYLDLKNEVSELSEIDNIASHTFRVGL